MKQPHCRGTERRRRLQLEFLSFRSAAAILKVRVTLLRFLDNTLLATVTLGRASMNE